MNEPTASVDEGEGHARPSTSYASPSFREDAWRNGVGDGSTGVTPYQPTILHALADTARLDPDTGVTILPDQEGDSKGHLPYRRLHEAARRCAEGLRRLDVGRGDRVLLVLIDPGEFLAAFFGTQLLGALPVPAYPPAGFRIPSGLRRLAHIAIDAKTEVCVTSKRLLPVLGDMGRRVPHLRRMVTVPKLEADESAFQGPQIEAEDAAFLQYTSGSTDRPRGVVVTHHNLVSNVHAIGQAVQVRRGDALVSWCPLYHDMGLIGGPMFCLYWRIPLIIMSPLAFLRSPERWPRAIHEHRATLSPAPNFGFALAVRRVGEQDREGLDLSSWRVALNGAEIVNPSTTDAFVEAYGPHGFRPSAMMPVYGLAEATLAVTFAPVGTGARVETLDRRALARGRAERGAEGRRVASVGRPIPGQRVRIVDEDGQPLPERHVGRVQVAGPSVMKGYHDDPEATAEVRDGPWLRTGDLGYMADGELFLTGRAKDVIILSGRNYHAEDLERSAETLDEVRDGACVAFSVYDEEAAQERVVLVCESRGVDADEADGLKEAIRMRVQEETTVPVDEVVLVERGTIPKTSSGKRQRSRCRALYLGGRLRPIRTGKLHVGVLLLRSTAGYLKMWLRRVFGSRDPG